MAGAREHWLLPDVPYLSYAQYREAVGRDAIAEAGRLGPDEILQELLRSGLRGRGGAGFPAGVKWRSIARHSCKTRDVVMNAAEGEPGTFKDRWLLRRNPYAAIEGLLIAARVVGARKAWIAMKASFVPEVARVREALSEMAPANGGIEVEVVEGPEEYLFGEEKALLSVIEGGGPLPRAAHYPPYELGLFATPLSPNPALVSNVETFAHVPSIVRAGARSFRTLGTDDTPGTILCTLSGDVARPGVYEVEAGIPLATLFADYGGGPKPGRTFVAALSGVASAPIGADRFDVHADFGSLQLAGSGLGSAGFIVLDDRASMPRVAQAVGRFLYVESCNQCSACKAGLRAASRALDALFDPERAGTDDLDRVLFGARQAPQGNRCYLPVQGSLLLPSLVSRFRSEFDAQAKGRSADAPVWPIPKIIDFDETTRTFAYDEQQALKEPNWSYREAPHARTSVPAPSPVGDVGVRLDRDVATTFEALAALAGTDLDAEVNDALREWLRAASHRRG